MKGRFIVVEGVDGSGKDSIIKELEEDLQAKKIKYVVLQDPSPVVAKEIRNIILNTEDLEESTRLYLYLAARSELIYKQIVPALAKGTTVICNRFSLSTYAYQGLHFSEKEISEMHRLGRLGVVKPDLEIVLLSEKSHREKEEEDVMGEYCNNFRQSIIKQYLKLEGPNTKYVWTDEKTVSQVYEEVLGLLKL